MSISIYLLTTIHMSTTAVSDLLRLTDLDHVFFKVQNQHRTHNGFKYVDGFNQLPLTEKFEDDSTKSCCAGGLYITNAKSLRNFLSYGVYISIVELPLLEQDFKIVKDKSSAMYQEKWRVNMLYLRERFELDPNRTGLNSLDRIIEYAIHHRHKSVNERNQFMCNNFLIDVSNEEPHDLETDKLFKSSLLHLVHELQCTGFSVLSIENQHIIITNIFDKMVTEKNNNICVYVLRSLLNKIPFNVYKYAHENSIQSFITYSQSIPVSTSRLVSSEHVGIPYLLLNSTTKNIFTYVALSHIDKLVIECISLDKIKFYAKKYIDNVNNDGFITYLVTEYCDDEFQENIFEGKKVHNILGSLYQSNSQSFSNLLNVVVNELKSNTSIINKYLRPFSPYLYKLTSDVTVRLSLLNLIVTTDHNDNLKNEIINEMMTTGYADSYIDKFLDMVKSNGLTKSTKTYLFTDFFESYVTQQNRYKFYTTKMIDEYNKSGDLTIELLKTFKLVSPRILSKTVIFEKYSMKQIYQFAHKAGHIDLTKYIKNNVYKGDLVDVYVY